MGRRTKRNPHQIWVDLDTMDCMVDGKTAPIDDVRLEIEANRNHYDWPGKITRSLTVTFNKDFGLDEYGTFAFMNKPTIVRIDGREYDAHAVDLRIEADFDPMFMYADDSVYSLVRTGVRTVVYFTLTVR